MFCCDDVYNTNRQACYKCNSELVPLNIWNMEFFDSKNGFKRSYIGITKHLDPCNNDDRDLLNWIHDCDINDEYKQFKRIL